MSEASKGRILIVDDEALKRVTLQIELTEAGYEVSEAQDADQALALLASHPAHVVIADLRLPEKDGLKLLQEIKAKCPETHVLIMTAFGSIDTAVEAMKLGAYDFLAKPFKTEVFLEKLEKLRLHWQPRAGAEMSEDGVPGDLCAGTGLAARQLAARVRTALATDQPVLLTGATGSGKTRLAEWLHLRGRRPNGPLIKCSSVASSPEALEASLFGAPSTASDSNGQTQGRGSSFRGQVELANGGTLYLADVDQLPPGAQVRLLRVLEDRCLWPCDRGEPIRLEMRFVFGTARNLHALSREGRFREDLYYRMASTSITLPTLRDRREDLPLLTEQILHALAERHGSPAKRLDPHALERLAQYDWPGNLRELEHVLNQACGRAASDRIVAQDIVLAGAAPSSGEWNMADALSSNGGLTETVAGVERTLINTALKRAAGNQAKAAKYLGIPRTTLRDKMTKYGLVGDGVRLGGGSVSGQ